MNFALPRLKRIGAAVAAAAVVTAGVQTLVVLQPADAATLTGIDVSRWDHPNGAAINWPKVKQAGRQFAIIKATEGTNYVNPYYASDIAQARAAGLVVGAYHFAQPRLPVSTAAEDARHYIRTVGSFRNSNLLPPVLDLECSGTGTCTYGKKLTVDQMKQWTKLWLDTAEKMTGRTPILYTYDAFWRNAMGNTTAFTRYPFWYARYTATTPTAAMLPGGWSRWTFWQFTSTQTTPGLPCRDATCTKVGDVNRFNGTWASLKALADGSRAIGLAKPVAAPRVTSSGDGWAKVQWDSVTDNGGAPVVDYTVSVDGGEAQFAPHRVFIATGLSAGPHSFTIRARTVAGFGEAATVTATIDDAGAAAPSATSVLSIATPSTVKASATFIATARLLRSDTGQAIGNANLTWEQRPKKGAKPALRTLITSGDGTALTSIAQPVTTWHKVTFAGGQGLTSASATRTVAVTPWVTAKFRDASVPRGTVALLDARSSYLNAGDLAVRQAYVRGAWRSYDSRRLSASGHAVFSIRTSATGTTKYRVVLKSSVAHLSGSSATATLKVW